MEQEVKAFLDKFVAALRLQDVETIPFSGNDFQRGVNAMNVFLQEKLEDEQFCQIEDAFVKVPVDEVYQDIRGMLMTLNGDGVSFSGADNPMWKTMRIKMNPFQADKILNDDSVFNIDKEIMRDAAETFCDAAGVILWEKL